MGGALFELDADGGFARVAGCPPDYFSADGQLWGNPLYNWEYHKKTGYAWWVRRVRHALGIYDLLRIDHFRGFDTYWAIPADSTTARTGKWENGPGMELFDALEAALGKLPIIAEDLGELFPSVRKLLGLGAEAHLNTPGKLGGNWAWRAADGFAAKALAKTIHDECSVYCRV